MGLYLLAAAAVPQAAQMEMAETVAYLQVLVQVLVLVAVVARMEVRTGPELPHLLAQQAEITI